MRRIIIFLFLLSYPEAVYAKGLGTLIEVGKSQADIASEADEETNNFDKVKSAIETGEIKPGQTKDYLMKRYGAPVIEFNKKQNGRDTWVYKSAATSFFNGTKIYLYFDDNAALVETKIKEPAKKEDKK